ncbi:MAG: polysaccharide pyruvyl transferase family protein [Kiritimatiellae bacterium]|nr:polysaccharide pyruvyl transferase family protein [Kiritimatiellia bacterium]
MTPLSRKILIVHNPAIGTDNLGDEIIMRYCNRVLARCFPFFRYRRIDVPTHAPVDRRCEEAMKRADLQIVCGTNILCPHVGKYNLWKMEGGVDRSAYRNIVLLACGWNRYSPGISEESRALYRSILSRDRLHCVRDAYTERRMEEMGFRNVVNTNCVTLWGLSSRRMARIPAGKAPSAVFTLTAHRKDPERDAFLIETLLGNYRETFFWPQGNRDKDYFGELLALSGIPRTKIRVLERSLEAFDGLLDRGGIDYVGTRLHGGCHALNRGRRALIVALDNRATEIARDTNLPVVPAEDVAGTLQERIDARIPVSLRIQRDNIKQWKNQF